MYDPGNNELLALLGDPVSHSKSPDMYQAVFKYYRLNWHYFAFEVNNHELEEAVYGLKALNFLGGNVTAPYKELVINYLDEVTPLAKSIGAVNTLMLDRCRNSLIGDNTDGAGFINSLTSNNIDIAHKKILILGAGGAARAVSLALSSHPLDELLIVNRTKQRAVDLSQDIRVYLNKLTTDHPRTIELGAKSCSLDEVSAASSISLSRFDIIINAMSVDPPPTFVEQLLSLAEHNNSLPVIVDLRYGDSLGDYFESLKQTGFYVLDGFNMLIHQGAISFERWSNKRPPFDIIKEALNVS